MTVISFEIVLKKVYSFKKAALWTYTVLVAWWEKQLG